MSVNIVKYIGKYISNYKYCLFETVVGCCKIDTVLSNLTFDCFMLASN